MIHQTDQQSQSLLDAALAYAARGWHVIPLHDVTTGPCSCGNTHCTKPGKHPRIEEWTTTGASLDPAQIQRWWKQWPTANVGILTGERSHLAVLDVDPRNGGDLALEDLEHSYHPLPDTPMVISGGKGPHHYFALDGPLGKFDPGPGLNLQADGALVIAPPSLHQSGNTYEWEASSGPDDVPLAPLPDWLRALGEAKSSAPVEGVDLPDSLPAIDIQTLKVSHRIKYLISMGHDPDDPQRYRSRSEALFAVLQALLAGGHDDATLASVVMDQRYGISAKVLSQKNARNPRYREQTKGWVAREIARAKAKHHARTTPDMTASATAAAHQGRNGHTPNDGTPPDDPTKKPTLPRIKFDRTATGAVRPALLNLLYVLEQDPQWRDTLGFDALLNDVVLLQCPPYLTDEEPWTPRAVTEQDHRETANWLQRRHKLYASSTLAGEGLTTYASRFPFHPVRQYLTGLAWDGNGRLDSWLTTYCHAMDSPYVQAVASKTLIAAVARAFAPGCKVDTMTILEGEQGDLKSTVWSTLANDAWFTDWLPDLHDKDAAQALQGTWIVEFAELSHFQRTEIETVKRFLSTKADHYRPSYGRKAATFPRQNIFVGSTNDEHYFKDNTGNRRFWPIKVQGICDIEELARHRDQLWAEAVSRYRHGERWYLSAELETIAREEQAQRLELDDWEAAVMDYTEGHKHLSSDGALYYMTTLEILRDHFQIENPLHHTQANTKRLGGILRRNGWKSKPVRAEPNGKQFKAFTLPVPTKEGKPVTGNSVKNPPTGNSESRSNDAACTGVTGVTGVAHTQGANPPQTYTEVRVQTGTPVTDTPCIHEHVHEETGFCWDCLQALGED